MSTCINIGNATAKGTNLNADGANMHEYIVAGFADMAYVCGQGHVSDACNFVHIHMGRNTMHVQRCTVQE